MTEPTTPSKEDIEATQAGASAGATAVAQGLTREQVQDAIEQAIANHNPPNMSDSDIEKVADVLAKRFEAMGAFEKSNDTEPPAVSTPPVSTSSETPDPNNVGDKPPTATTFADRFLKGSTR